MRAACLSCQVWEWCGCQALPTLSALGASTRFIGAGSILGIMLILGSAAVGVLPAAAESSVPASTLFGSCTPLQTARRTYPGHTSLVDHEQRIMLMFTPKGGATVAAQIFLRYEDLLKEAYTYSTWVHNYRLEVFNQQANHVPVQCTPKLCSTGWTCIRLIRQPLDRVVSTYAFAAKGCTILAHWDELKRIKLGSRAAQYKTPAAGSAEFQWGNYTAPPKELCDVLRTTSFDEFTQALTMRSTTRTVSKADDHFMPQVHLVDDTCDGSTMGAGIFLVPVEFLSDALPYLGRTTGVWLNATGQTSSHYNMQNQHQVEDDLELQTAPVPFWPYSRVAKQSPPYELFTSSDSDIGRRVCCLFREDIEMYRRACRQPWMQLCTACVAVCNRELERLRSVCGTRD